MSIKLRIPQEMVEEFCRRWQIKELAIFGSALGDDSGPTATWMCWWYFKMMRREISSTT